MAKTNPKIEGIIKTASKASAKVAKGMPKEQGLNPVAIVPIQTGMIMAIANEKGKSITRDAAAELLKTFAAKLEERLLKKGFTTFLKELEPQSRPHDKNQC